MEKWEYTSMIHTNTDQGAVIHSLNEMGEEGWELVAIDTAAFEGHVVFYFKRQPYGIR